MWSAALDKFSIKKVYGLVLVLQIIFSATMEWAKLAEWSYAMWIWMIVWLEGAHFALAPNILKIIYGDQATKLMGVFYTYTGLLSICLIIILWTPLGTLYIYSFSLCCLASVVALLVLIFVFKSSKFQYV